MNRFFDITEFCLGELMPAELRRRGIRERAANFVLHGALRFRSNIGVITVPDLYLTDLASIPAFAWGFFLAPDDPRISAGAVVHDWLYGNHGIVPLEGVGAGVTFLSRKQCDQILAFEAMRDLGATWLQQWCVYLALRWFGDRWKDGQ